MSEQLPLQDESLEKANSLYYKGVYKEAFKIYMNYAKTGHIECGTKIGWMCCKGEGVDRDINRAKEWFLSSYKKGDLEAGFGLGRIAFAEKNYSEAFHLFIELEKLKYPPATYWVGRYYSNGIYVEQNINKAFMYYTQSASTGHFPSRRERAKLLLKGKVGMPIISNIIGFFEIISLFISLIIALKRNPNDSRFLA